MRSENERATPVSPISLIRRILTLVSACGLCVMLGACGILHGDNEVRADPEEGRSDGPGLFTGKRGAIEFEEEVWTGSSPFGDIAD